jgi:hypothetical protein
MPLADPAFWSAQARQTLARYREPLLRAVAGKLLKPRSHWPVEDLVTRMAAIAGNAAVIDRRLGEVATHCRQILALIGRSRQPRWRVGGLVEAVLALGHADGLAPVQELLESGLIYPILPEGLEGLAGFEQWLAFGHGAELEVFAHPHVTARAIGEPLGLPLLEPIDVGTAAAQEADGLEWPLRLAVLWQQVAANPLRRTLQGEFFKRDLERLSQDPLLSSVPSLSLADLPDVALLAVSLAEAEGLLEADDGELRAGPWPGHWQDGLGRTLEALYAALPRLDKWNARDGSRLGEASVGQPCLSAYVLALLLLACQPPDTWSAVKEVEAWVETHHPYWKSERHRPLPQAQWMSAFLLGLAQQLRLVQAAQNANGLWTVRLTSLGHWLLAGNEEPPVETAYARTLFVQPNLEIVAYRQGLTPALIQRLTQLARWKSLGAACTLQLEPETVYRALERGLTFEDLLQTLEQHGMRPTPAPVIESLRTWSNKRDRISVYGSAALLEFATPEDLNEALQRGLPGVRLSECLALVAQEEAIDYRNFRLTGTRDYSLPPEKCVTIEPDGVSLTVELARSDLLLETELPRFAERVLLPSPNGRHHYRLTPASVASARAAGLTLTALETWFRQRSPQPLSPAARLLFTGAQDPPGVLQRQLVLTVATAEIAQGLLQWPETRDLIADQLGPTALVIAEENLDRLKVKLGELGLAVSVLASP